MGNINKVVYGHMIQYYLDEEGNRGWSLYENHIYMNIEIAQHHASLEKEYKTRVVPLYVDIKMID